MKVLQSQSFSACLNKCKSDELCNWYSYNEENKLCVLLEDCELDENQIGFESGQAECTSGKKKFL